MLLPVVTLSRPDPSYIAKGVLLDEYPDQGLRKGDLVVEEQLPFGEMVFKRLTDKMFDTYKRKNADYGSSFDELFDEFGMDSVLIRLKDKYNRIKSLNKPAPNNRSSMSPSKTRSWIWPTTASSPWSNSPRIRKTRPEKK